MIILTKVDLETLEEQRLATYALKSRSSKGRAYPEPDRERLRTNFQVDRDRILHSKAFRRLSGKTQVLSPSQSGDHFRDRLTHTLEVAQISRSLARNLNLNQDAAEAIALAHDLGHTPFGHAGEEALNECLLDFGSNFEHNQQSLRQVAELEQSYPDFRGLNLSYEILEGLDKHQTPYDQVQKRLVGASLEAQIVNIADEIAYLNHDIDDGLRLDVITLHQLEQLSLWRRAQAQSSSNAPSRIISSLIKLMQIDLLENTAQLLRIYKIQNLADVYATIQEKLVAFTPEVRHEVNELRHFLHEYFYASDPVQKANEEGQQMIHQLFKYYLDNSGKLPTYFQTDPIYCGVRDYLAGMTDGYAELQWQEIFATI